MKASVMASILFMVGSVLSVWGVLLMLYVLAAVIGCFADASISSVDFQHKREGRGRGTVERAGASRATMGW